METYPWNGQGTPVASERRLGWSGLGRVTRGLKFLVVCALALVMSLLALFVAWLTEDRSTRAAGVRQELSTEAGGPQVFLGPMVFVPYTQPNADPAKPMQHGVFAFSPSTGKAAIDVHAEERRRSLYRVPVFQSEAVLESRFGTGDLNADVPAGATLDWSGAVIAVGVSNVRSALQDGVLETRGGTLKLRPLPLLDTIAVDPQGKPLAILGAPVGTLRPDDTFTARAALRFSGAERLTVPAYAGATEVTMQGNWPDPGFQGTALPVERSVSKSGFTAKWFVPAMARGVPMVMDVGRANLLGQTAMAVNLVELADPYQSVERALKYAPLFLGLVFLSYFLFEVTAGKPVHVAQYVLVGFAQLVFYLLLLSFAERLGFDWAFLLGGGATVLLLSGNAGWVFQSARQRRRALAIFSGLYALIYCLLRLEDNALLVGALGSFVAIGVAMYFTRDIDWYGSNGLAVDPQTASVPLQVGASQAQGSGS